MKRILITGASSGIGLEAARLLACSGHPLTLLCRTPERGEQTRAHLLAGGATSSQVTCRVADLADLRSVQSACDQLLDRSEPLDALVLNAGQQRAGAAAPVWSPQGIEITFAVNQLAHQLSEHWMTPGQADGGAEEASTEQSNLGHQAGIASITGSRSRSRALLSLVIISGSPPLSG